MNNHRKLWYSNYEEKVINGVLCWRQQPIDTFKPATLQELTTLVMELQNDITALHEEMAGESL